MTRFPWYRVRLTPAGTPVLSLVGNPFAGAEVADGFAGVAGEVVPAGTISGEGDADADAVAGADAVGEVGTVGAFAGAEQAVPASNTRARYPDSLMTTAI